MWSVVGWDGLVRGFWGVRLVVLGMWVRLLVGGGVGVVMHTGEEEGGEGVLDKNSMADLMSGKGFSRYRFLRPVKEVECGLRGVGEVLLILSLVGLIMSQFFEGEIIAGLSWGVGLVVLLGLPIYLDVWVRMARVEKSEYVWEVLSAKLEELEELEEEVGVDTKYEEGS